MIPAVLLLCVLVGTRTLGPLIKSQLLYQLSYEDNLFCKFTQCWLNLAR